MSLMYSARDKIYSKKYETDRQNMRPTDRQQADRHRMTFRYFCMLILELGLLGVFLNAYSDLDFCPGTILPMRVS